MNKLQADMPEQGPSKGPAANERLSSAELGIIIANQIEYKRGLDQVGPMPELTKDYISFTKGCYLSLVSELPKDADAVDSQLSVTKSGLLFMEQKSIKIAAYNPEIQNWLIEKEITSYQPDEAQQLSNLIVGTMGFTESVKNNDGSEMSYEQRALAALKYASADLGNKVSAESNILFLETGIVEITKDDELIAIGYDNKALAKIFKDKRSYSLLKEKIKNMQSRMSQDKRSRAGSFTTSLIDQVINDNIEQKFGLESKDNLSDTEALRQHIYNDYGIYVRSEESHKENTYGKIDQLDIALIVNLIQASQPLLNGIKEIEKNVASSAFSDTETTTKTIKSILIDDNMASFFGRKKSGFTAEDKLMIYANQSKLYLSNPHLVGLFFTQMLSERYFDQMSPMVKKEFRDTIPKFDQSLEYARLCNPRMDSIDRTDNVTKYFFAREATQYFMSGQPSLSDKNSTHSFMQNLFCK